MISANGRRTTSFERNYASHKGELAAIIYGLRKYEHILRYRPFIIRTDSGALKYLQTMKDPRGITARWLHLIQTYDFQVVHLPGKQNQAADALSRSNHMNPASAEEEAEEAEFIDCIKEIDEVVYNLSHDMIVREQKADETTNCVRE